MRLFNSIGEGKCKICGTSKEGQCGLIPVDGTAQDNTCEAIPVHIECLELRYSPKTYFIYMSEKAIVDRNDG